MRKIDLFDENFFVKTGFHTRMTTPRVGGGGGYGVRGEGKSVVLVG